MLDVHGLTSGEAKERLQKYGFNTLPEEKGNPLLGFLEKFWAPIPWVLEFIILLEMTLGKYLEAGIIFILLLFNALVSFFQEGKAKNALQLLRNRLNVRARVLRDGAWQLLPAQELVPNDIIRVRMGDIIPADIKLLEGRLLIDQSALTGESLPVEPSIGKTAYAGSIVKHGEAYAEVINTGERTYFGKTAEIVRVAKTPSHLERTIFLIVKYLIMIDIVLVIAVFLYSLHQGFSLFDIIPFSLLLLVASVPVALPATYVLATALGAIDLAKSGVLVTRLSAIEEAAAMSILCVDKTGTITENILSISSLQAFTPFTAADLLTLASLASEEATQDPIDLAIFKASKTNKSPFSSAQKIQFIPFDPERKCSEAIIDYQGQRFHVLKGAPVDLLKMASENRDISKELERLSADGSHILGVVFGTEKSLQLIGLIALQDLPRASSKPAIEEIHHLGVKVQMITGDGALTAKAIADKVGIGRQEVLKKELSKKSPKEIVGSDIFCEVFPEDKFHIIQLLQKEGYICGMTGDGVNDAPALKKAEVGIAVSNATDVAKAAASLVLTNPGLVDVVEAIKSSRRIYQRMLTYTLNKIIKTLEIAFLLSVGLILTNQFIITQLLIVLLLFANDFVTMSLSTDRVSFSLKPDKWDIKKLTAVGAVFAGFVLAFSFAVLFFGIMVLHLSIEEIRTLVFLTLVFTGQATVYLVRERHHFWHSKPSGWMILCSSLDITVISILAMKGIFMTAISPQIIWGLFAAVLVYFICLDFLKIKIFKIFRIY